MMELLDKRSNNYQNGEIMERKRRSSKKNISVHGLRHFKEGGICQSLRQRKKTINKLPIYEVPFPAITICPETKAQKSIIDITSAYLNLIKNISTEQEFDETDLSRLEALTQVCDSHLFTSKNISDPPTLGENFADILRELAVPQSKVILFCKFRNELVPCAKLFEEVITDDGICYSFNLLKNQEMFTEDEYRNDENSNSSIWSRETGYKAIEAKLNDYPNRALANYKYGLNVVLSQSTNDLDFICKGPVQGFKVRLHAPDDHPNMADGFITIPLNSDIIVATHSNVDESNKDCHTTQSKRLTFFKNYSQRNCIAECLSKFVKNVCNCTKFSMVHARFENICSQRETQCVVQATEDFFVNYRIKEQFLCDCKPSCVNYDYTFSSSEATFDFNRVFRAFNESLEKEFPASIMSRLNVYFKNDYYIHTTRFDGVFNDFVQLFSQIGGILAFFLGASIISIVEIVFFTLEKLAKCNSNQ